MEWYSHLAFTWNEVRLVFNDMFWVESSDIHKTGWEGPLVVYYLPDKADQALQMVLTCSTPINPVYPTWTFSFQTAVTLSQSAAIPTTWIQGWDVQCGIHGLLFLYIVQEQYDIVATLILWLWCRFDFTDNDYFLNVIRCDVQQCSQFSDYWKIVFLMFGDEVTCFPPWHAVPSCTMNRNSRSSRPPSVSCYNW